MQTLPRHRTYDVIIVGGAMMGSAVAWYLSQMDGFQGRVLVIERDPTYATSSTAHTNSCMRQQFSSLLNIRISQYAAAFVKSFRDEMGGDPRVPDLTIQNFGYLYLADTKAGANHLRWAQAIQASAGAGTRILTQAQLASEFAFFHLDDILIGSHNTLDEGYWDGGTVFDWFKRSAREHGVEYVANTVTGLHLDPGGTRVTAVTLATGEVVSSGVVVNAAGPRAAEVAAMAGIDVPIEPRKRFTYVFRAEKPLDRDLPLTIDPSGIHVRQDGPETYMAGASPAPDPAVDPDDFAMDHAMWETHVWPLIATRIPQFEAIRVVTEWVGHYAYNTLDQNAVIGPHPDVQNFVFVNGFSGHGLQQAPAMGRGIAEWITHGAYQTLDLSPFGYERVVTNTPMIETAVI